MFTFNLKKSLEKAASFWIVRAEGEVGERKSSSFYRNAHIEDGEVELAKAKAAAAATGGGGGDKSISSRNVGESKSSVLIDAHASSLLLLLLEGAGGWTVDQRCVTCIFICYTFSFIFEHYFVLLFSFCKKASIPVSAGLVSIFALACLFLYFIPASIAALLSRPTTTRRRAPGE